MAENRTPYSVRVTKTDTWVNWHRVTILPGMTGSLTGSAAQVTVSGNVVGYERSTDGFNIVLSGTQNPAKMTMRIDSGSYQYQLIGYTPIALSCSDQVGQYVAHINKFDPSIGEFSWYVCTGSAPGTPGASPTVPVECSFGIITRNNDRRQ